MRPVWVMQSWTTPSSEVVICLPACLDHIRRVYNRGLLQPHAYRLDVTHFENTVVRCSKRNNNVYSQEKLKKLTKMLQQ